MPGAERKVPDWSPADSVTRRKFRCEVEEDARRWGDQDAPRLQLMENVEGRSRLVILVPAEQIAVVRDELVERGYRGSLPVMVRGHADYGSWIGYLNELEVAHIVVEMLEWTLTPEEQAMLDAVDEYGRRAPTGFRSPRLRLDS
jgi:hypothetical protein